MYSLRRGDGQKGREERGGIRDIMPVANTYDMDADADAY